MNATMTDREPRDDAVLACEVSDETLEAAASATPQALAAKPPPKCPTPTGQPQHFIKPRKRARQAARRPFQHYFDGDRLHRPLGRRRARS